MISPYINFNGNCRAAVEFYAEVFETKQPRIITFGDMKESPEWPVPEEAKKLIMHTELELEGTRVMFSDLFPGMPRTQGDNISLAVMMSDRQKAESLFKRLSEDGEIEMELQETEWSGCYGSLKDQFGIHWQINLQSQH